MCYFQEKECNLNIGITLSGGLVGQVKHLQEVGGGGIVQLHQYLI